MVLRLLQDVGASGILFVHDLFGYIKWGGVGGMLTFLDGAHMVDTTERMGLGWDDQTSYCTNKKSIL